MGTPYAVQLADKAAVAAHTLRGVVSPHAWLPPVPSVESGHRNKAKLVVGGETGDVTLGILDADGRGVDLRSCGLYEPALAESLPSIVDFVNSAGLQPYSVRDRRGELKYIIVTVSPGGELMVRFVGRSTHQLARLQSRLPGLLAALPQTRVVTLNVHPEHKATVEGDREIVLTSEDALPLQLDDHHLLLPPRSFFQTNTALARELYRQAAAWVRSCDPATVWDLYCGIGGFTAYSTAPGRDVLGVEVSAEAIAGATRAIPAARFLAGDATAYALAHPAPDLVIVNPPRRGLSEALTAWLEGSTAGHLIYSSCNPATLARDLAALPSWRVTEARLFDLFPQTTHCEVAVHVTRSAVAA